MLRDAASSPRIGTEAPRCAYNSALKPPPHTKIFNSRPKPDAGKRDLCYAVSMCRERAALRRKTVPGGKRDRMSGKRYFWLKLPEDFFRRGYVRQMRRLSEGDRLTVIYLEMLLLGLKTGGELCYEGAEDPAEELALELFEPPEEVRAVLEQMTRRGKILPREGNVIKIIQ